MTQKTPTYTFPPRAGTIVRAPICTGTRASVPTSIGLTANESYALLVRELDREAARRKAPKEKKP